jgi:hypothetical protein
MLACTYEPTDSDHHHQKPTKGPIINERKNFLFPHVKLSTITGLFQERLTMLLRPSLQSSVVMLYLLASLSPSLAFRPLVGKKLLHQRRVIPCFSTISPDVNQTSKASATLSNTGGLRRLPVVRSPNELMNSARKASLRVRADR